MIRFRMLSLKFSFMALYVLLIVACAMLRNIVLIVRQIGVSVLSFVV